ncbi:hypothetical protein BASA81_002364 [Batrachochytrium salamandrivorans]|nr:hypothetical protein BASA81_002364 [Batrachochytrium salamandrivorans]
MQSKLFCALPQRSLVRVAGVDAANLLQSFTTVDVRKSSPDALLFGAFLNPKGRILHDFFMRKLPGGEFDLETSKASSQALVDYLNKFKFRKKAQITLDPSRSVFAVWGDLGLTDPRFPTLARRLWAAEVPQSVEVSSDRYHEERMRLGFCEGDEESFEKVPFQLNYDFIPQALCYDKGCYTGQELIARTHFKGQVRKRILPVELEGATAAVGSSIDPLAGEKEDSVGEGVLVALAPGNPRVGLAAFRDAQFVQSSTAVATHEIKETNTKVHLIRPEWWPAPPAAIE